VSLLLIAAGASAALGSRFNRHGQVALPTNSVSQFRAAQPLAVLPEKPLLDPEQFGPALNFGSSSLAVADASARKVASSTRIETPARSAQTSEKVLVFDAMRALRREGDPNRAAKLLDEYLRRYPEGSLSEEALALSIETSTARGDSRAKTFADRYLARYPAGRFRAAAEHARARFAP
jgi:predicted Zn-dependent protease